jgi:hypothetical protein
MREDGAGRNASSDSRWPIPDTTYAKPTAPRLGVEPGRFPMGRPETKDPWSAGRRHQARDSPVCCSLEQHSRIGRVAAIRGWGGAQADRSPFGEPLPIAGRRYDTGLGGSGTHDLEVRNDGQTRFYAQVGADDSAKARDGAVTFEVYRPQSLYRPSRGRRCDSGALTAPPEMRLVAKSALGFVKWPSECPLECCEFSPTY